MCQLQNMIRYRNALFFSNFFLSAIKTPRPMVISLANGISLKQVISLLFFFLLNSVGIFFFVRSSCNHVFDHYTYTAEKEKVSAL